MFVFVLLTGYLIILGVPAGLLNLLFILIVKVNSLMYLTGIAVVVITIYYEGIKGGSPGKLLLGLRVQNKNGRLIGFGGALLRYIGKILSTLILGIGFLMIAWDKNKQGLHDKIASTYVVKKNYRKGLMIIGLILGIIIPIVVILLIFSMFMVAFSNPEYLKDYLAILKDYLAIGTP